MLNVQCIMLFHFACGFGFAALLVPVGIVALVQLICHLLYAQALAGEQYGEVIQQVAGLINQMLVGAVGGLDNSL